MNLLNKSISSQRTQLNFLMVGANSSDPSRGSCLPRSHSMKEGKPTLLRKIIVFATSGGSRRKESFTALGLPAKQSGRNCLFASIHCSFLKIPQSLIFSKDQQCSSLLTQPKTQDEAHGGVMTFGPFLQNFGPSIMENGSKDGTEAGKNIFPAASNGPPLTVAVVSAVELESSQMDQIAKKMKELTGCTKLRLENTVDPSVIAGFVISYERDGQHLIDLSVKGQLYSNSWPRWRAILTVSFMLQKFLEVLTRSSAEQHLQAAALDCTCSLEGGVSFTSNFDLRFL